jgi:hypothetical protein
MSEIFRLVRCVQANEQELQTLFGAIAGFRQMKLNHGARGITCFVEYEDVLTAMEAHKNLQVCSKPRAFTLDFLEAHGVCVCVCVCVRVL